MLTDEDKQTIRRIGKVERVIIPDVLTFLGDLIKKGRIEDVTPAVWEFYGCHEGLYAVHLRRRLAAAVPALLIRYGMTERQIYLTSLPAYIYWPWKVTSAIEHGSADLQMYLDELADLTSSSFVENCNDICQVLGGLFKDGVQPEFIVCPNEYRDVLKGFDFDLPTKRELTEEETRAIVEKFQDESNRLAGLVDVCDHCIKFMGARLLFGDVGEPFVVQSSLRS